MRHHLRVNASGKKAVAGRLYFYREIARNTGVSCDVVSVVLEEFFRLVWNCIANGVTLKLGEVGTVTACSVTPSGYDADDQRRPFVSLRGKLTRQAKEAWYKMHGHEYDAELLEADVEEEEEVA